MFIFPDFYAIECITQEWSFFSYNHVITALSWKTNFLVSFVLSFTYCVRKRFRIHIFYFLEVPSEMSIHFYLFNSFPLCFIDDWIFQLPQTYKTYSQGILEELCAIYIVIYKVLDIFVWLTSTSRITSLNHSLCERDSIP